MSRLEELLAQHLEEQRSMREELTRFVHRQTAILDAELYEELLIGNSGVPPAAGGTVTDKWTAQVSGIAVVTGLLVITQALAGTPPVTATTVTLTLGNKVLPIQNTTTLLCPMQLVVFGELRQLVSVYPAGAWTQGAYVGVWGYPASINPPGRLGR